jgi:tetratricopeptide (TPR) repeat protein
MGRERKVMATNPVPNDHPNASTRRPRPARPSLWAAPLFVVGVGALVAVCLLRPIWPDAVGRRLDRELEAARGLLGRANGDGEEILRLAENAKKLVDQAPDQFRDRLGEVLLVAGSAHIRLADSDPLGPASPHWESAADLLQQAEQVGVAGEYQFRLSYRLGKAFYYLGKDFKEVVRRLSESEEHCDNQAECYALLTQAYLHLPQPDLKKALEYNEKLRGKTLAGENELAEARLLGGELLARQKEWEKARKALDQIGEQAPPLILARALLLRARTFQEEGNWSEAARVYNVALTSPRLPFSQPTPPGSRTVAERALPSAGAVYFNLGVCWRQLEQPAEAARAWSECVRLSEGPEGQVASLYLADLIDPADAERSLKAARKAMEPVKTASEWNNPILKLEDVRTLLEHVSQGLRQAGRFDLALQMLDLYDRVAQPGRILALRGEVSADWARARREQAARSADAEGRANEEREANELFLRAATACSEAARQPGMTSSEQIPLLWTSAGHYLSGGDWIRASEQLELVLKLDRDPARQGEGWYRLAEAYRNQNKLQGSAAAYRKSLEFETRYAYLSRYQLAMASLENGDSNEAVATLTHNLTQLRFFPDAEAQEKTMFKLGALLHQRREYLNAVRHLEVAIHTYKHNPEVPMARFLLADSYWKIANQITEDLLVDNMTAEKRAHFQGEYRRWLEKAAEEFSRLDSDLDRDAGTPATGSPELPVTTEAAPAAGATLPSEQRIQVPFIAAKCFFNLGKYAEALQIYERLKDRYKDKVEMLEALGGEVKCHAALGQEDQVMQRLLEINLALPKMDESVREPWTAWIKACQANLVKSKAEVARPLQP